jgi:hypothetical protein
VATPLPRRRCETCRHFVSQDGGSCSNPAIAQDKDRVTVRPTIASCAGLYFGQPDFWEPKQRGWWPFGR